MSLVVAIQMDPMDSIDIKADSTFVLAMEAQDRGYKLYHYLPKELALDNYPEPKAENKININDTIKK